MFRVSEVASQLGMVTAVYARFQRRKSSRLGRSRREVRRARSVGRQHDDQSTVTEDSPSRRSVKERRRRSFCPSADTIEDKTQQEKKVHRGTGARPSDTLDVTQQEKRKARKSSTVAPEVEKVISGFVKYATETTGFEGLRNECNDVLDLKPESGTYERFNACPELNRYPEIPCLDATRVVLQTSDENKNDYIHANKVKLDKLDRDYILTQGPKSNTIEDFWRMIFQEQCVGIVMLCNYTEEGNQNCEEFFPTESTAYRYYGKMFVNNKRIDHLDQYNVYTLEVLPEGCSNSIITRLAHCTKWPEKAVPSSGRMVLRLIRWMEQQEPGCIAMMCSAGIGRTGTFLAIEAMCTRLFKGCESKVKDTVLEIRKQRALCVHNELQYFFIYSTVLDYIRAKIPKFHSKVAKFYAELSKL